jgi:hypothetical protein
MRSFQVNMAGTRCHLFMWIRRTVGRHFTGTLCQGLVPRNTLPRLWQHYRGRTPLLPYLAIQSRLQLLFH